ncbi:MAG TPA: radical SAM protein [Elusimicrobiales bacterium]|nr:radical SAM protein [Elusimicrobiales bacterium]
MRKPNHLVIYLSGLCNLACAYCYAGFKGRPVSRARLVKGLDAFFAAGARAPKITFLGGEPCLHPALLKAAVAHVRRRGGEGIPVRLFSNGTLLTRSLRAFLERRGVKIVLSLDGPRRENDRLRRFRAGGGSVYDAAAVNWPGPEKPAVSLVVTPDNAARLPENVDALLAEGFKSLAWAPDLFARWEPRSLRELKAATLKVKAAYFRRIRSGAGAYEIANIYEMLDLVRKKRTALPPCSSITLGPDGFFYPCDKIFSGGLAGLESLRIGAGGEGREKFFGRAAAAGCRSNQAMCAVAPWALRTFPGAAGAERAPEPRGQAQVRALVSGWLRGMARQGLEFPAFRRVHGVKRP